MNYYTIKMLSLNTLFCFELAELADRDLYPFVGSSPIFTNRKEAEKAAELIEKMYDTETEIVKLKVVE